MSYSTSWLHSSTVVEQLLPIVTTDRTMRYTRNVTWDSRKITLVPSIHITPAQSVPGGRRLTEKLYSRVTVRARGYLNCAAALTRREPRSATLAWDGSVP